MTLATKTDDVRSPELVRHLRLENEAEVVDNLGRIRSCEAAVEVQKARIAEMSKEKKRRRSFLHSSDKCYNDRSTQNLKENANSW